MVDKIVVTLCFFDVIDARYVRSEFEKVGKGSPTTKCSNEGAKFVRETAQVCDRQQGFEVVARKKIPPLNSGKNWSGLVHPAKLPV